MLVYTGNGNYERLKLLLSLYYTFILKIFIYLIILN